MTAWLLVASVFLLFANAFFVAVEFGLIASRRAALEPLAEQGDRRARRGLSAIGELNLQLAGAQLGITMSSLALGAAAEPALAHLFDEGIHAVVDVPDGIRHAVAFAVALTFVVLAHMVVGEMVPKNIAIAAPERTILALATLNRLYVGLFRPVIRLLNGLANAGMRLLGVAPVDELHTIHTADELARLLAASREDGVLEETAHNLLSGALDLGGTRLVMITVPRAEVVAVPVDASVEEAERLAVEHGVSRLLVMSDGDDVAGFVHVKDLLTVPAGARRRPLPLARVRRVLVLDGRVGLDRVLLTMRRSRTHVAAVLDEQRRFVGIATLEDVLEEVVGDIEDESDIVDTPPRG
ncbi:MAG: hemolysin family protein [Acidimicrobiales bacterium]